ncbi:MAG: bifunctional folylpolyglutamate synthase/dihydrofolate synthase [Leptospiraceae bacterium]|nr:bifunctional folylpolyglutamate synthase/dihydrofolate synthase [Leptospiraceae bacterium]
MNINQFLSSLTNLEKTRNFNVFKDYSLDEFISVLDSFDLLKTNENTLRISLVGTNGKGSTAFSLSQLFLTLENCSPVGLYTSPHLIIQNERIQVNGDMISDEWMNHKLNTFAKEEIERLKTLSYFEFFTFLSILFFKDNGCKTEIYEAGLGGRLDATKLVNPNIVVLTEVSLDHTEILGNTEEKILLEKLNIIGNNTKILFTFLQEEYKLKIIESFCNENNIELIVYPHQVQKDYLSFNKEFALFIVNHILARKNQPLIKEEAIDLIHNIPGRMQILRKNPILLFDTGHNPSAAQYILQSLKALYPHEKNWNIYFGSLKDKDSKKILEVLVNDSLVQKVFQINGETWNNESIHHSKIIRIPEDQLIQSITQSACLILGSFRLYHPIKQNEF